MIKQTYLLPLALLFCLPVFAQTKDEVGPLTPGQPVEREIAGGESHTYQISLAAGQFVRFRLEQRAIDAALTLTAPDGKQMVEMNLTGAGQEEPLSLEVAAAGSYRLTVRVNGVAALRGSYRLEATVQATTTAQDRQRQAAEALLVEATELSKQGGRTAQQVIEKLQQAEPLWRELGEPSWAAHSIFMMGTAHNSLSQFEKTIEYCNQALVIYRELKDRRGEAEAFTILGRASRDLGRNAKAIEYSEQALVIHRELNNKTGEAGILNNMGRVYAGLGRQDKAVESLERALAIYREVRNKLGEGTALNNLGIVVRDLGRTEKSIENHEQALAIARESKNRQLEADSLVLVGRAYTILGRNEKTIQSYEQALTIYRELKNRNGEANALLNLGLVNKDLGRNEITIEYSAQALTAFREVKNRTGEGNALNNMGRAYAALGLTEKAVESLEGALAIYHELRFRLGEGNALNNLGIIYRDLGRTEKSIENYEQALAIARELKNQGLEADSLILLGRSFTILGRNEKTIECFEQARTIYRELKNRFGEANAVNNLGSVYEVLGRNEKAIEYYEQGLAIYREIMNKLGEGTALNNIGVANKDLGRHEKAIEYSEQALAIYREIKYRFGEANALFNLATVNYQLRRYEKAGGYYTQSLGIYREIKNPANEGYSLNSLGAVSRALGRIEEAVKYHEAALKLAREIKSPPSEANSLAQLARDEEGRGNLVLARQFIEEHLRIAESVRAEVVSKEDRAEYLATVQGAYQLYVDVLMRQHRAEPGKGLDALAVEVSERLRARSLLDLLAEARADIRRGVDAQLLERERSLGQQLNQKAQLLTKTVQPVQLVALRKEISQLESNYERTQADIRKASPNYAALTQPQPLKLKEIQAQLDADTLLLEYALGAERSYLWAITKDSLTSYALPKEEQIKQNALQVYELLTARSASQRGESVQQRQERIREAEAKLPAAAQSLSETLLAPVAAQLGNKRLVIVADGALQYIPFAMLPEPVGSGQLAVGSEKKNSKRPLATDHRPLIVSHEVVSLPSASALAIQRRELAGRQLAPKMLAVIADPVFDRSDSRFTTPATDTGDKAQTQTITGDDARSIEHLAENSGDKSGVTTLRFVIPRLPFTRQEATRVLALTPKNSSFGAIDFQANRATVLSGNLSQYRYVHFATHGVLDSERPGLSALVLSMVDAQGRPQDGFVRTNDIYNLKLPAELVVLSACQTGLGKEIKGEGLVGLTRGFMYAGAARVVVSLWNVNDKATADLMAKFYEKMLKQGERPAAALRAAQVEMWKQKQWQSPYYWAAFTMQGEWR